MKCENCGKGPIFGHNVSHSKRRTNRRFTPNIHTATIQVAGKRKQMKLCTRCLRTKTRASAP